MKKCSRCQQLKERECFGLRPTSRAADGRSYECVQCHRERNREYQKRCKDKCNARRREWAANNRDKTRAYSLSWVARHLEESRARNREWIKANKSLARAYSAKRRAAKLRACPAWLSSEHREEMSRFYQHCPDGHEVDHIYPLQGDSVSGLHVPWNLQYLPSAQNKSKSNKIPPSSPPL